MTGTQKYVLLPMQPDQGTPILSPVDVGERCASGMIMWMPQAKKPLVIMKRKGISMKIVFKEPLKSAEPGQRIELKKNKSGEWDVVQKGEILESGPHRELAKLKRDHYMGTLSEDQCSADAILYAHIHCHSDSSLLDGMAKVPANLLINSSPILI